ncbi:TolC family protein [Thermaurantiacus tibetensis]|uniref:TolC family protein n=1 Tax=Thermaurantiacus tibetensis TaxID=2759035 RepID=UPI00188EEB34|nr:TolC family protein [Thermaurantiacus tibetensis]
MRATLVPLAAALAAAPLAVAPAAAEPLTLEAAIAAAQANSPRTAAAEAEEAAAAARLAAARGAALPTATVAASVGAGRLDPRGYFGLEAADVSPRAVQLAVEAPLFTGGRIDAARAAARAGLAAAEAGRDLAGALLAADVAAAFADLAAARQELALRRAQLAEMREIERQAGLRFRAGEVPSTEVSQARARRAEAEAGLADAEGRAAGAEARLVALTGAPPGELAPLPPPPQVPATAADAVVAARAASPGLAVASARADAAAAQARAARASRLPEIGAFAEAASLRDQFFPDYVADQAVVGVRARWVLFDASRHGRVAEGEANARAAALARDDARRTLEAETVAAHGAFVAAGRMVEAARARAEAAEAALRSIRLEAKVGMKPQLALLDAEREALDAAVAALRAEGLRLAAAWRLKALTGT